MNQPELRAMWESEVTEMRVRIKAMRQKLFDVLSAKVAGKDFSYLLTQRGMFSYTGLSPAQVERLREEFAVYMVKSGRMCVAGLNNHNVEKVANAMIIGMVVMGTVIFSVINQVSSGTEIMPKLFLVFFGAIITVQIIPGLILLATMIKGFVFLGQKKQLSAKVTANNNEHK